MFRNLFVDEVNMKPWLVASLLSVLLSASGCTGMLIGNALNQGQNLTPEQIKAYKDVGADVYGCFQIGGPAPAGNTQWIVMPIGKGTPPKFMDGCHISPQ